MIHIGTAGWSYPDWEGAVYPKGATATDRLRAVAEFLDCVEVDSTFYRPPTARTTANWVRRTADRPQFRFLAKAWQRFTHERQSVWSPAEQQLFTDGLAPLREAGRLDVLLFQFPWSFRNDTGNRDWLARIADKFAGWPVAIEVRHDSWTPDFCRDRQLIYCNVDQPQLSHCLPASAHVTAPVGYFRLHGRNAKNWFKEKQEVYGGRYDYLYNATELDEVWGQIRQMAGKAQKTFAIFNNHKDAKAFSNALQLKLRAEPGAVVRGPVALLNRFPELQGAVQASGEEQLSLV
jgi:uncharacterized protein YecE (DUF72 family)